MKVTNVTNLPQIIVDWAENDPYERGTADYTTTELVKPARILALERRHAKELSADVTELTWRLSGQAKHVIFQRVAQKNPERYIAEERFEMAVAGVVISGQLDLYDRETSTLWDYKETKVWKQILGDTEEWTAQSNINAFLCVNIGNLPVHRLCNIVIFKDWSIRAARNDHEYPQLPIRAWPLDLWDQARTLQYIQQRVSLHKAAEGEKLPLCTPAERWQKPPRWAVMKQGRKRAVKLFDNARDADVFIREASDSNLLHVESRPNEDTRCLFYCDVAGFCDHGRQVLAEAQKL
jgi:hypothetical protein